MGARRKEKRKGERERERRKCLRGEVIKEGASWLAWQQFKGGGFPVPPLHPNGSCWHRR